MFIAGAIGFVSVAEFEQILPGAHLNIYSPAIGIPPAIGSYKYSCALHRALPGKNSPNSQEINNAKPNHSLSF